MEQGKNIIERIYEIREKMEKLKSEINDTAILDRVEKIQKHLEKMQYMLPEKIYQFTTTHYEGYINISSQIEKEILELKESFSKDIENVNAVNELEIILTEIKGAKIKAERRLKEKSKKI